LLMCKMLLHPPTENNENNSNLNLISPKEKLACCFGLSGLLG
jgi:hypothetical protein